MDEGYAAHPDPSDLRPWEQPGEVRRDVEPHRAGLLGALAQAALLCGLLSCCFIFTAPVGLALGVTVWALAAHDLAGMRAGLVDPAGERDTRFAVNYAKGVLAASCLTFGAVALLLVLALFG
jgi:hypothetical protein